MKLLLDENLPHQLRHEVPGHDCFTVIFMGWSSLENGALLARAAAEKFDALLTMDANLQYQQNLRDLPVAVVVPRARSSDVDDLRPLIPEVLETLRTLQRRAITHVG